MSFSLFLVFRFLFGNNQSHSSQFARLASWSLPIGITGLGSSIPIAILAILTQFYNYTKNQKEQQEFPIQIRNIPTFHKTNITQIIESSLPKEIRTSILSITPFQEGNGFAQHRSQFSGMLIRGFTKNFYHANPHFKKQFPPIVQACSFQNPFELFIGIKLAKKLSGLPKIYHQWLAQIQEGRLPKIILFTSGNSSSHARTSSSPFIQYKADICGIFKSNDSKSNEHLAFSSFRGPSIFNPSPNIPRPTHLGLLLKPNMDIESLKKKIQLHIPFLSIVSWRDMHPNLSRALDWERNLFQFLLFLILVLSMGCLNLMYIRLLTLRKKVQIGVLKTLGFSLRNIKTILAQTGFIISFAGLLLGNIIAIAIIMSFENISSILDIATTGEIQKFAHMVSITKMPWNIVMQCNLISLTISPFIAFLMAGKQCQHSVKELL